MRSFVHLRLLGALALVLTLIGGTFGAAAPARAFTQSPATVFINEIHYDNNSTDTGEFIEVAGPAGTDLTGWSIVLYNGATPGAAVTYDTDALPTPIPDLGGGFGVVVLNYPSNGIQNGTNDAIALVNNGVVVQFLSYEGVTTASNGPAAGLTSTDIGVSQNGTEPVGSSSLYLTGTGSVYSSFSWTASTTNRTSGAVNTGQTLVASTDTAPSVSSVTPANSAVDVVVSTNVTVTFSEAVNVASGAFSLSCGSSPVAFALSGGPTTFTLDPSADLPNAASCTLTVSAAAVTDQDAGDPPDTMAADVISGFTTVAAGPTITPIHAIQGSGAAAAAGTFTIEAIVVGDYQDQGSGRLRGFFVQEEDADADANSATSEGIFVFCSACPTPVAVGDKVRVTGASSEFFNMSQLTASTAGSVTVLSAGNPLPTPASVQLPVPGLPSGDLTAATAVINAYFEAFEGMLVTFPDTLSVSEYFELARYGQVILTEGGRPRTFTDANTPSAAGLIDHEINLAGRTIILDDTDNRQNRPVDTPNTNYYHPVPGLSTGNFFRGGDTITNLTGVLHWSFAGQSGTDAWRIRPVAEQFSYAFTSVNPRPAAPSVGGSLKVASFNVLNYFLTIDATSSSSSGPCGANQLQDCRGADSAQELERQRAKLTQALLGLDADIVGLIEMENTPNIDPALQIVTDLNAILGPGTYATIDTGVIGTDAIRVGIIYKPGKVTPVGDYAILDSSVDPNFIDTRNRPALAQTFAENANGARFTVAVNHFKSKGSGCGAGDDDTTTGQGNCNGTRTLAAQALASWLATDPTDSGDPDTLIIGDLNSYAKEDPIVALQSAGYTNLVAAFGGADAYSYVFDGQLGYLDHALANPSLTPQVAGVTEWHINADEIPLFDYNDDVRDVGESSFEEESDTLPLFAPDAFRTSDHDPVLIGLSLDGAPPVTTAAASGATNPLCPSDCFQGSATVTLSASDASGVAETRYRVNSGPSMVYSGPFVITTLGANLVEFFSTDNAGNVETVKSATVKVTNFPGLAVLDSFTRANGRLGGSWSGATQLDQYRISGNAVSVDKGGPALWRPTVFGASQEAFLRLTALNATSKHHTLVLKSRGANARNGAILVSYDALSQRVSVEALVVGQGFRTVASFPATLSAGSLLGARALSDGTVLVYADCQLLGTADTRTVAGNAYVNVGGQIGVWFQDAAGAAFDDFGGGSIAP